MNIEEMKKQILQKKQENEKARREKEAEERYDEFLKKSDAQHRMDFGKCLRDADYSQHNWELFRVFLTCATYSMQQAVNKLRTGELDPAVEENYMKEIKRVKHPKKMSECLGILTMALEKTPYDFLGTYYSEESLNDKKWAGQCFTPTAVSQCIAEVSMCDLEKPQGRSLLLAEPACGGGSMVIAATEVLKKKGLTPWDFYWVATDVSWNCFCMCYVQCTLLYIPATIIHGNTLTLEEYASSVTLAGVLHPPRIPPPAKKKSGTEKFMETWNKMREKK
jgi:type I restriction-modification system DNA methylase subunit